MKNIKIAVWLHHGLGDVVMALPMLYTINYHSDESCKIFVIVKSKLEEQLVRTVNFRVNNIKFIHSPKKRGRLLDEFSLAVKLRRENFDIFLAVHATNRIIACFFSLIIGAKYSVGPSGKWSFIGYSDVVCNLEDRHKVHYYSAFAKMAKLYDEMIQNLPLNIPEKRYESARLLLSASNPKTRWIFVAPSSGGVESHKRWPVEKYRELIDCLINNLDDFNIGIIGGENEIDILKSVSRISDKNTGRCYVFPQTKVGDTIALIKNAECIVTGCSGSAHIACMADIPIIGIYGPTNYLVTGPFTKQLRIVSKWYDCSPCYRKEFITGCGNAICMSDVSAEEVYSAVIDTLEGKPFMEYSIVEAKSNVPTIKRILMSLQ